MMEKAIIQIKGLSKEYSLGTTTNDLRSSLTQGFRRLFKRKNTHENDKFVALNDVSFDVFQGEILGVIGRNGAGKSTLLKILSQITMPTHGEVEIEGRVASLLEIGTGFHEELTGRENVFLNGSILGMRRAEVVQKFDQIVEFSGVQRFMDTPMKKYSSGMKTRLAFAVAAHLDPEILLVDEVLAVGDIAFQKKCLKKMGDVAKSGRTILFVSHNLNAVQNLCDRCVLLDEGRLILEGKPLEVISHYLKEISGKPEKVVKSSESTDHQGIQLSDPMIRSYSSKDSDIIKTNDRVIFSFKYAIPYDLGALYHISVRLLVNDQYGQRLFVCDSNVEDQCWEQLSNEGEISCITEPLKLVGGPYSLDVVLKSATVKTKMKGFLSFDVMSGDYLPGGAGRQRGTRSVGYFAVQSEWKTE